MRYNFQWNVAESNAHQNSSFKMLLPHTSAAKRLLHWNSAEKCAKCCSSPIKNPVPSIKMHVAKNLSKYLCIYSKLRRETILLSGNIAGGVCIVTRHSASLKTTNTSIKKCCILQRMCAQKPSTHALFLAPVPKESLWFKSQNDGVFCRRYCVYKNCSCILHIYV